MAPSFAMLSGLGINLVTEKFKKYSKAILTTIIVIYLCFFESYLTVFLTEYSPKYSNEWQYGYRQLFESYSDNFNRYQHIIVSDEYAQPYIFALFYQKYDPEDFRKSVVYNSVDRWGFSTVTSFDKFIFKKIDESDLMDGTLVFATDSDKITNIEPVGEVKNYNGTTAFWIYSR
jgi:hypothetical protein